MRDVRITPFNIGVRIELTDFTESEAAPLAAGLGRPELRSERLRRVLHWTAGHPYLTQRLCQAIAASRNGADVDRLCDEIFLSRQARQRDDNLLFVRERILRSQSDLAALLSLYARVLRHRRVSDDDSNPLVGELRLAGVCRGESGARSRNRSKTSGTSRSNTFVTAHEEFKEEGSRQYWSLDEQWEELIAHMMNLDRRQALVKVLNKPVVQIETPEIKHRALPRRQPLRRKKIPALTNEPTAEAPTPRSKVSVTNSDDLPEGFNE